MVYGLWSIKFTFDLFVNFHEKFIEAIKIKNCNIHGSEKKLNKSFMIISWDFNETTIGKQCMC